MGEDCPPPTNYPLLPTPTATTNGDARNEKPPLKLCSLVRSFSLSPPVEILLLCRRDAAWLNIRLANDHGTIILFKKVEVRCVCDHETDILGK